MTEQSKTHGFPNLKLIDHPVVRHKINLLRDKTLSSKSFREVIREISVLLTYEACSGLSTEGFTVSTWCGDFPAERIKENGISAIPVLRAGLGMTDGFLTVLPGARVSMIGIQRDEKTAEPGFYFQKFHPSLGEHRCFVLDPMLATGGSLSETVARIKQYGAKKIVCLCVISAPEGVAMMKEKHPDVLIYTAALDEKLDKNKFIVPGLGDAGDRIFNS